MTLVCPRCAPFLLTLINIPCLFNTTVARFRAGLLWAIC